MGMKYYSGALLFLVVTTSIIFSIARAKTYCTSTNSSSSSGSGWSWSYSYSCSGGGDQKNDTPIPPPTPGTPTPTPTARTINIDWKAGIDYQMWAVENAPFFVNDILVFNLTEGAKYSVSIMKDSRSYFYCDFTGSKQIKKGSDGLFSVVLKAKGSWSVDPNYYFASKIDCTLGMKLSVFPMTRW